MPASSLTSRHCASCTWASPSISTAPSNHRPSPFIRSPLPGYRYSDCDGRTLLQPAEQANRLLLARSPAGGGLPWPRPAERANRLLVARAADIRVGTEGRAHRRTPGLAEDRTVIF